MAHFAELDQHSVVIQVVVVANAELLDSGVESEAKGIAFLASLFGNDRWVQTSYNGNIRRNFASIGFTYDASRDAFVPPQPFPSWTLNEQTCRWVPPPYPSDDKPTLTPEPEARVREIYADDVALWESLQP
jgi:hypothetical protein